MDVVNVINQHKNAREAERKAEAEKHYREQQRIENELGSTKAKRRGL
jgi:hypothetical protein